VPASQYPDAVEAFKQQMIDCWLARFAAPEP
jgi:hypothetical protein